jgi:hypothetical protein
MRSRQSSRNLANIARRSLFILLPFLLIGCAPSFEPTYTLKNLTPAIEDICFKEYKIFVKATFVGKTLWVYIPVEGLTAPAEKPERYAEKFQIDENSADIDQATLSLTYAIKGIPEEEKLQTVTTDKDAVEKINNVWRVLRRVIFSMSAQEKEKIQFFCMVIADIQKGALVQETFYTQDIIKYSYGLMAMEEFQHRSLHDSIIAPEVIGDKEGKMVVYRDIKFEEFITDQIKQRIRFKFQKPEVEQNVDIDKEVQKVAAYVLEAYGVKNISSIEFANLQSGRKNTLSKEALMLRHRE